MGGMSKLGFVDACDDIKHGLNNLDMDRHQRAEKPRAEKPIQENEIRITSQGRMRNYITYAMTLLEEKGSSEIVFKAMGGATPDQCCTVAVTPISRFMDQPTGRRLLYVQDSHGCLTTRRVPRSTSNAFLKLTQLSGSRYRTTTPGRVQRAAVNSSSSASQVTEHQPAQQGYSYTTVASGPSTQEVESTGSTIQGPPALEPWSITKP